MAIRHTITDADAYAARQSADAQHNGVTTSPTNDVSVRAGGKSHSITFRGSNAEASRSGVATATVQPRLQPGFVRLSNGQITPLRAAQSMGLEHLIVEHGDSDHRFGRPQPDGARPVQSVTPAADETTPADTAQTIDSDVSQLAVAADDKVTIEAGASALASVNQALGSEMVNAAIDDAIVSGELPTELPASVSQQQVGAIVAALTAQANTILTETGASVALMDAMLDAHDLQEARRATYLNDDRALKSLGAKAIRALERLPENPRAFAEFDLGPNVTVEKKNGEHWVRTPQGSMPWGLAVRTGRIKLG